jgi:hypothetical protein
MQRRDGLRKLVAGYGVVEDRKDPLKLGRVRVRWFGFDTDDKERMPTESLPWAMVSTPIGSDGHVTGLKEGDWVIGLFMDGPLKQKPVVLGQIHNIPEEEANPLSGFSDPTADENLVPEELPRPPFMGLDPDAIQTLPDGIDATVSPDVLPGEGTAFGVLEDEFRIESFPFDVNKDGVYDWDDAEILSEKIVQESEIEEEKESLEGKKAQRFEMSRYPLKPLLKVPTTNAFERGKDEVEGDPQYEIVREKKGELIISPVAEHQATGIGTDQASSGEPILEPEHPYNAKYPFNKTKYTESGHLVSLDDTPGAERVEIVHRSGTFKEIHPTGDEVSKVKKTNYHFVLEDYLVYSGKDMQLASKGKLGLLGSEVVNIKSEGNINQDARNLNSNISGDINTKIGQNVFIKIEGDVVQLVIDNEVQIICRDKINLIVDDDLLIDGKKDIKIAARGALHLEGRESVSLVSNVAVGTAAPITSLGGLVAGDIRATTAGNLGQGPLPYFPTLEVSDSAEFDNEKFETDDEQQQDPSQPKEGFWLKDGPRGDLWKPVSDTKPFAVSLSISAEPHELYEAIPTGELENVTIYYIKADGSTISWDVVRPKHKRGRLIEKSRFWGIANGNRYHWVWSKMGHQYPQKQMFLKIGNTEHFILNSSVRHDALF